MLETEFLECTLMVSSLATRQESYQKSIVEVRCVARTKSRQQHGVTRLLRSRMAYRESPISTVNPI